MPPLNDLGLRFVSACDCESPFTQFRSFWKVTDTTKALRVVWGLVRYIRRVWKLKGRPLRVDQLKGLLKPRGDHVTSPVPGLG